MFEEIENYIQRSRVERMQHLKLADACIKIGGYDSREYRGLLAHYLKTTIPTKKKVVLCHACNDHWCSNVNHMYWGTHKDNHQDKVEAGHFKNVYQATQNKYGDQVKAIQSRNGRLGGQAGGGKNRLTNEELDAYRKIFESVDTTRYGWISKVAKQLELSHTHVRRIFKRL